MATNVRGWQSLKGSVTNPSWQRIARECEGNPQSERQLRKADFPVRCMNDSSPGSRKKSGRNDNLSRQWKKPGPQRENWSDNLLRSWPSLETSGLPKGLLSEANQESEEPRNSSRRRMKSDVE
jgi:hypothetical protein